MKSAKEITLNYLKDILENRLNAMELYKGNSQGFLDLRNEYFKIQQVIVIVEESEGE